MLLKDQIGRILHLDRVPTRIISLVPSQTELLVHLGLRDHIVGITKFCVHPEDLKAEKQLVGGTKQVHYDKIKELRPDIILCNKEENTKEMVDALQKIAPVHVSDVKTIEDSHSLIQQYGDLFDKQEEAGTLIKNIEKERSLYRNPYFEITSEKDTPSNRTFKAGYFIWKDPLMVAGEGTFIDSLLEEVGFVNAFKNKESRYPEVSLVDLKGLDYILLSSEPFPFSEKHFTYFQENNTAKIILVNGEYFSWYGSRLLKAYSYFSELREQLEL